MDCTNCGQPMLALFTTWVCENCENMKTPKWYGYVVYRLTDKILNYCVFPTFKDADEWKKVNGIKDSDVCLVALCSEPVFKQSTGILKNISIAQQLYEIYPDNDFEPKPHRGYVIDYF